MVLCPLTIIFKSVTVRLRLKRAKSDLTSIAQDPALSATDPNSVDLQRPSSEGPHGIVQSSTHEGSVCRQVFDHDWRCWIVPVPPDDAMFVA